MSELSWSGPQKCECGQTVILGIMSLIGVCGCGRAYVDTATLKGWFASREEANKEWEKVNR